MSRTILRHVYGKNSIKLLTFVDAYQHDTVMSELLMAETETASATPSTPADLSRVPSWLRGYAWPPGVSGNPHGRPFGAKARTVVERAETRLTKKYVARALDDAAIDQGAMLRHAIDKFLPDAGAASSTNILLMSAEDMSAIQQLASSLLMVHSVAAQPVIDVQPATMTASAGTERGETPTPPLGVTITPT